MQPLSEARRQAYLDALGIIRYVRRDPDVHQEQQGAEDIREPALKRDVVPEQPSHPQQASFSASPVRLPDPSLFDWPKLEQAVSGCQACGLHTSRTQTVFGVGDKDADLMLIGEAPGADEDRLGEPFVGRAGQLLDAMLRAMGLDRRSVYIANILKCRPPGNRNPSADEAVACQGYLDRQIQLLQPKLILAMGAVAAHNLLSTDEAVGRLRQREHLYGDGLRQVPLRVTYHPAYLLRQPEMKAKSWQDLKLVMRRLDSS